MSHATRTDLTCLWMDLRSSVGIVESGGAFERQCRVERRSGFDAGSVERQAPDFVVLEFDYPSRQDLARAASFKQQFSGVPMVVVSVQHSEALAVWFFRARFYDFLSQPLASRDVNRCISELQEIKRFRRGQQGRSAAMSRMETPSEAGSRSGERTLLQPALNLVERSYHQRLRVTEAAEKCALPPFRFGRIFKEQFGMDFRDYVLRYRIREACRLLRNPKASITEVGYAVGFSEPSYFTRMFKKLVGRPPSEVLGRQELGYDFIDELRA